MENSPPFGSLAPVRRWATIGILSAAIAAVLLAASPATAAEKPRVTVIGDSVQASFSYVPKAVSRLGKGLDLKVDALQDMAGAVVRVHAVDPEHQAKPPR